MKVGKDIRAEGYLEGENSVSVKWVFGKNSRVLYVLIDKIQGGEGRGMGRGQQILRF